MERSKDGYKYIVRYKHPSTFKACTSWVGVENITSLTVDAEKQKRVQASNKQLNVESKRQTKNSPRSKQINHNEKLREFSVDVEVNYDPTPDGNCQFDAFADQRSKVGVYTSAAALRDISVQHITKHQEHYERFIIGDFAEYVQRMKVNGTYRDHVTMQALAREFNCQCLVISTAGRNYTTLVSNDGHYYDDITTVTLGHFPEDGGMHYVSLNLRKQQDLASYLSVASSSSENNEF